MLSLVIVYRGSASRIRGVRFYPRLLHKCKLTEPLSIVSAVIFQNFADGISLAVRQIAFPAGFITQR